MLTLDTSGILAALDRRDPHHAEARAALVGDRGPFIVAAGVLAEAAYMIDARLGADALGAFLLDLEKGAFTLYCGEDDLSRVRALVARYRDLPLGYADAAVIACGERNAGRVLTFDFRHFPAVAREGTIRLVGFEEE